MYTAGMRLLGCRKITGHGIWLLTSVCFACSTLVPTMQDYHARPCCPHFMMLLKWIRAILNTCLDKAKLGAVSFGDYFQKQYSQSCSDFLPHSIGISQAQFQMVFKGWHWELLSFIVLTGERAGKYKAQVLWVSKLNSDYFILRNLSETCSFFFLATRREDKWQEM